MANPNHIPICPVRSRVPVGDLQQLPDTVRHELHLRRYSDVPVDIVLEDQCCGEASHNDMLEEV